MASGVLVGKGHMVFSGNKYPAERGGESVSALLNGNRGICTENPLYLAACNGYVIAAKQHVRNVLTIGRIAVAYHLFLPRTHPISIFPGVLAAPFHTWSQRGRDYPYPSLEIVPVRGYEHLGLVAGKLQHLVIKKFDDTYFPVCNPYVKNGLRGRRFKDFDYRGALHHTVFSGT